MSLKMAKSAASSSSMANSGNGSEMAAAKINGVKKRHGSANHLGENGWRKHLRKL
jgi:hypothetical protein